MVLLDLQVILDQLVRQACLVPPETLDRLAQQALLATLDRLAQQALLATLDRLAQQACLARQGCLVRQVQPELLGLRELILLSRDQLALPAAPVLPAQLVVFQTQLR